MAPSPAILAVALGFWLMPSGTPPEEVASARFLCPAILPPYVEREVGTDDHTDAADSGCMDAERRTLLRNHRRCSRRSNGRAPPCG